MALYTDYAVYIDYARAMWKAEDVKNVFNNILNENIVASVEEWSLTSVEDGEEFKRFIVRFSHSNVLLGQWFARIRTDGFLLLPIDMPDYVKKGAERYWKLLPLSSVGQPCVGQSCVGQPCVGQSCVGQPCVDEAHVA